MRRNQHDELHVVQAQFGDSLILESGTPQARRFILIDGGPPFTFKQALHESLKTLIPAPRVLDAVVLSHVDNDHIIGLLDLVAELRRQQSDGEPATLHIRELWHNSFSRAIDPNGDVQTRLRSLLSIPGAASARRNSTNACGATSWEASVATRHD